MHDTCNHVHKLCTACATCHARTCHAWVEARSTSRQWELTRSIEATALAPAAWQCHANCDETMRSTTLNVDARVDDRKRPPPRQPSYAARIAPGLPRHGVTRLRTRRVRQHARPPPYGTRPCCLIVRQSQSCHSMHAHAPVPRQAHTTATLPLAYLPNSAPMRLFSPARVRAAPTLSYGDAPAPPLRADRRHPCARWASRRHRTLQRTVRQDTADQLSRNTVTPYPPTLAHPTPPRPATPTWMRHHEYVVTKYRHRPRSTRQRE